MNQPNWLHWAQQIQALAQAGLIYTEGVYDRERYLALQRIAAEMMAFGSNGNTQQILDLFTQESGYPTPKIDVRGVVFRDGKILLVKERADGGWTLPGGWADVGDSPAECAVREIREESGFDARAVKLLAIYDRSRHGHPVHPNYVYKLFFLCELLGGTAVPSIETEAVDFFAVDNLPPLSLSRVTAVQIQRMFDHYRHPEWPTDFD